MVNDLENGQELLLFGFAYNGEERYVYKLRGKYVNGDYHL